MLVCTVVELLCGLIMEFSLKMTAWSYKNNFLNFRGHICLSMSLLWGALGILFSYCFVPVIDKVLNKLKGQVYKSISLVVTIILTLDFILTTICIIRWKDRHYSIPPKTEFGEFIDKNYNDDYMEERFAQGVNIQKIYRYLDFVEDFTELMKKGEYNIKDIMKDFYEFVGDQAELRMKATDIKDKMSATEVDRYWRKFIRSRRSK